MKSSDCNSGGYIPLPGLPGPPGPPPGLVGPPGPPPGLVGLPGLPLPIHPDLDSEEQEPIQIIEENGNKVTCFYRNTQMMCNYPPKPGFPTNNPPPGQGPPGLYPPYPEPEPLPYPVAEPQPDFPENPFPEPDEEDNNVSLSSDDESNEDSVTIIQNGGTTVYCSKRNTQVICNNYQAPNHFDTDKALSSRGSQRFAGLGVIASWIGSAAVKKGMEFIVGNYPALKEIAKDVYYHGKEAYNWLRGKKHETEVKTDVMDCTKSYQARSLMRGRNQECSFAFDYNAAARHHGYAHCTLKPHACKAVKEIGENASEKPLVPDGNDDSSHESGVERPDVVPEPPAYPGSGDNNMICNFRDKSGRNVIMACNYYANNGKK